MERAILEACDAAAAKKVALLPGAEEEVTNAGIDQWTLKLQQHYNKAEPGRVIMYGTYQAYLKSTPAKLARHLALARRLRAQDQAARLCKAWARHHRHPSQPDRKSVV